MCVKHPTGVDFIHNTFNVFFALYSDLFGEHITALLILLAGILRLLSTPIVEIDTSNEKTQYHGATNICKLFCF